MKVFDNFKAIDMNGFKSIIKERKDIMGIEDGISTKIITTAL